MPCLEKARANAAKSGLGNVEFRKGEIESLPVEDDCVDVVISNCVLDLVPDKDRAFREVPPGASNPVGGWRFRTWPGKPNPAPSLRQDMEALVGCIGGALVLDDYVSRLKRAGFEPCEVEQTRGSGPQDGRGFGLRAAARHRAPAECQHHGHQMRRSFTMDCFAHRGPVRPGQTADAGPLVTLWLVQRYGTAEAVDPAK